MQLLWLLIPLGGAVAYVRYVRRSARRRSDRLERLADELGFAFTSYPPPIHDEDFDGIEPFGMGDAHRASNLLYGRVDEIDFEIFDYHVYIKGKRAQMLDYGVVAARIPANLPRVRVRPEGWVDKFFGLLGFHDINFESEQFNRRYHVKSFSREAAYDLLHPQMMEFLLSIDAVHWQIHHNRVAIIREKEFTPNEIARRVEMIRKFVRLIPNRIRG